MKNRINKLYNFYSFNTYYTLLYVNIIVLFKEAVYSSVTYIKARYKN